EPAPRALFDERGVRVGARADEAELLALAFGGARELPRHRLCADLGLRAFAEGKDEALELCALRRVEEVALVFRPVDAFADVRCSVGAAADARVVSCSDLLRAEPVGEQRELRDLHAAVAGGARARRLSR